MPNLEQIQKTHPQLASIFAKNWELTLDEYAPKLYQTDSVKLEPLFLSAFEQTLQGNGYSPVEIKSATAQLLKKPVFQTSHHLTPTHGPTFFTLDLQCLSGLGESEPLLIGANSGVSFSNTAWSGALSFQDLELGQLLKLDSPLFRQTQKAQSEREAHGEMQKRISLIPSKLRDQLVFGEAAPLNLVEAYAQMTEPLQALLPVPKEGQDYSAWALQAARNIQKSIFGVELIVFDINQLVCNYLVALLEKDAEHPLCLFLFDGKKIEAFNQTQGNPFGFLGSYKGKKSSKVEILSWDGSKVTGPKRGEKTFTPQGLAQELRSGRICPGIALVFLTLHFFTHIKCLGSFNQIEYLSSMKNGLTALELDFDLPEIGGESLTTGRLLKGGKGYMPLDLAMNKLKINPQDFTQKTMGDFWDYYLKRLIDESS
ncbi:MAG: hypothetical protein QNL04_07260 [SAR324 cluster bacterium]|nr:hypothetical protein [SAR324 cluster bacterium]